MSPQEPEPRVERKSSPPSKVLEAGSPSFWQHHAVRVAGIFVVLFSVGTGGYHWIEGWAPFDAFYMTLITLTTIGYGETHPLSEEGRVFTSILIMGGVGNAAYALSTLTQFFASGGWTEYRRRLRMQLELEHLKQHTIVCGFGRLGSAIVEGLLESGGKVVVIERNVDVLTHLRRLDRIPYVQGDATDDAILMSAGILRAQTLVAALDDDAANVFLTLTARVLNPGITIYGKADDPKTLLKLERAGADHQFSPSLVAGHRVARQILRPAVMDLVELATRSGQVELSIEEFPVRNIKSAEGKMLAQTPFWGRDDFMILAIRTADGNIRFPPKGEYVLNSSDSLLVMGSAASLGDLSAVPRAGRAE